MAIEMGKKYRTRDGRDVRILCVDRPGEFPVVGIVGKADIFSWEIDGRWSSDEPFTALGSLNDLIEISPYSDIAIDAPGWWRMTFWKIWVAGHFAGVDEESGLPMMWLNGATSHTNPDNRSTWDEFATTKPEEAP